MHRQHGFTAGAGAGAPPAAAGAAAAAYPPLPSGAARAAQQQAQQQQHAKQQQQLQQAHHGASTTGGAGRAPPPGGGSALAARYELLAKIGEGTYGLVYLAAARDEGASSGGGGGRRLYAIKTFKTGREGDGVSPTAVREIALLRELDHPNIVRLEAVHVSHHPEPSISLAFGYAEHDLHEVAWHHRDRLGAPMDPYVVKSILWQLLAGLAYLHARWVVHRDLKPSNVLVTGPPAPGGAARAGGGPAPEPPGVVKIADFGLARVSQAPARPLHDNGVVVTIW